MYIFDAQILSKLKIIQNTEKMKIKIVKNMKKKTLTSQKYENRKLTT